MKGRRLFTIGAMLASNATLFGLRWYLSGRYFLADSTAREARIIYDELVSAAREGRRPNSIIVPRSNIYINSETGQKMTYPGIGAEFRELEERYGRPKSYHIDRVSLAPLLIPREVVLSVTRERGNTREWLIGQTTGGFEQADVMGRK